MTMLSAVVCFVLCLQASNPQQKPSPLDARNNVGTTMMIDAVNVNDLGTVKSLLQRGASANAPGACGFTPLMAAVQKRNLEAVKVLLDSGADATGKNCRGTTVLTFAKDAGCADEIMAVLSAAFEKQSAAQRERERTALLVAAEEGRTADVHLLLTKGADPNTRDDKGRTALMIAASKGNMEMVKELLSTKLDEGGQMKPGKGVDVNAADSEGRTALMAASGTGNVDMVKALLAAGAELTAADKMGKTAAAHAREANQAIVAAMLEPQASSAPRKGGRSLTMNDVGSSSGASSAPTPEGGEPAYKIEQRAVVNKYFEAQRQGMSATVSEYFCRRDDTATLFAVQTWEIVREDCLDGKGVFNVRVDSTNRGGTKITRIWTLVLRQRGTGEYCIEGITQTQ